VNEARARQLLSSLKSTTDLERIGDLVMSVAMRVQARTSKIPASDVRQLVEMSAVLRDMLDLIHQGFSTLDLECARKVLQMDKEIDRVCHALFQKHLAETVPQGDTEVSICCSWRRPWSVPAITPPTSPKTFTA
jgi:phosphate uptake regulator